MRYQSVSLCHNCSPSHLDASSLYITSKHAGPKWNWILELYPILDLPSTKGRKTFRDLDALLLLRCSLGLPQLCPQTHYTTDSHEAWRQQKPPYLVQGNWCQARPPTSLCTWCFFKTKTQLIIFIPISIYNISYIIINIYYMNIS